MLAPTHDLARDHTDRRPAHPLLPASHGRNSGDKPEELYLNLVLEYVPETVYSVARQWQKSKQSLPHLQVKLYLYQLCRALAQIHAFGICHRDIKPQNLLLNPTTHVVKLCDFGSAKVRLVACVGVLDFGRSQTSCTGRDM